MPQSKIKSLIHAEKLSTILREFTLEVETSKGIRPSKLGEILAELDRVFDVIERNGFTVDRFPIITNR